MTQKELAQALGISPGMVSRLAKRGMPTDSLERAQRWRKRHLEPGRVKGSRFDPNAPEPKAATPSPAAMDAAPLATLAQGIERLARAADAELTQWGPELTDLEPLRECLRVLPSSAPVPRLSVRTWVALVDHAMAHDAAARHHPDQGHRVSPEELHALIRPGQGGGMHWVAAACDSEATRSAMLALDLEPESTGMDG